MNETTTKERTMSKQIHVSHASCDHDKTPAARAKCRRIRRNGAPETSKAEIVARVKDKKSPVDKEITRRAGKRREAAAKGVIVPDAPVLRELLTLNPVEEIANVIEPACAKDDTPMNGVQVNVIAKGSKVVHATSGSDDDMLFACTKKAVNVDTAKITTNNVTCKNCLKVK